MNLSLTGLMPDGSVAITDEDYRLLTSDGSSYFLRDLTTEQLERVLLRFEQEDVSESYYRVRRVYHRRLKSDLKIFSKLGTE